MMAVGAKPHFLSAAAVFNDISGTFQVARNVLAMSKDKPKASSNGKVGRSTTKTMPPRIDAPVKDVARAVLKAPPPNKKQPESG